MLKIVTMQPTAGETVLRLEGDVIGPWVDELQRSCDGLLSAGPLALDLRDVSFVDRRGVALLQSLVRRGVQLRRCSALVIEQLRA